MTMKVTIQVDEGSQHSARVRTFNTAVNGERYHDNCDVRVKPGESTEVYLHACRMLEVTESEFETEG